MVMNRLHLDFLGAPMTFAGDAPEPIARIAALFGRFVVDGHAPSAPVFEVAIRTSEHPSIDHDLPLTWQGAQPDGLPAEVYEGAEKVAQFVDGRVAMTVDHAAGTADIQMRPDGLRAFGGSALMQIVDAGLGRQGHHMVHAATLVEETSGKAVLLSVKSGGGKTTTSLALARNGFALMTDDASVLVPGREGVPSRVWGLPRPLKVHRRTAELMPWVGPLEDRWDVNGEQAVPLDTIADRIDVMAPRPVEFGAVIHIGPRSPDGHRLTPMEKAETLVELAHENVAWRKAGMTRQAMDRFRAFARAVGEAPTFMLSAGTDLDALPAVVADAMRRGRA
jgi:hypothetical protein